MRITSEGPAKITRATIDAAWRKRKPDHRLIVRDRDCRGLALIVNPTVMAWSYAYRPRGSDPVTGRRWPNRTVTLGNPASLSVDDARIEANRIKGRAAAGADPAAERKACAEAERRQRGATLGRLADEYAKAFARRAKVRGAGLPSPRYVEEEMQQLKLAIAEMDATDTPAALLTDADVRRLLDVGDNLYARFGALSRFFDWCQDAGHVKANPCLLIARTRRPKARQPRAHYLTPAELARLWHAAGRLEEPVWCDLARFLIAMPCRRGEAARLDWSHVDLAAAEWRQPSHMTKNRDPHRLRLHAMALDVLQARRNALVEAQVRGNHQKVARNSADGVPRSGLVFPAPVSGEVLQTFTAIKAALAAATGPQDGKEGPAVLDGWTWHDFRRSFATALGEAGIPEVVADAVLNHRQSATRGGVLGVYQRASRWPEQVRAMEHWGHLLAGAIEGRHADANVVPMIMHAG
jgi:integrase